MNDYPHTIYDINTDKAAVNFHQTQLMEHDFH